METPSDSDRRPARTAAPRHGEAAPATVRRGSAAAPPDRSERGVPDRRGVLLRRDRDRRPVVRADGEDLQQRRRCHRAGLRRPADRTPRLARARGEPPRVAVDDQDPPLVHDPRGRDLPSMAPPVRVRRCPDRVGDRRLRHVGGDRPAAPVRRRGPGAVDRLLDAIAPPRELGDLVRRDHLGPDPPRPRPGTREGDRARHDRDPRRRPA